MSDIQSQKRLIRQLVKKRKAEISLDQKVDFSLFVFNLLESDTYFQQAKRVLAYWSMPDEVHTHAFIAKWQNEKEFFLPVVQGNDLIIRRFTEESSLNSENYFQIGEPTGETFIDFNSIDYVIVPGIGFDKRGNRLGRGKGFYDRLLPNLKAKKVGVCFDFQLFDQVPHDENDIPLDAVYSYFVKD
jgi:5-formyltetrahydrofolate cyclo-ligase